MKRVDIYGLGVVGACTAIQCLENGWSIHAVDPDEKIRSNFYDKEKSPWPEPLLKKKLLSLSSGDSSFVLETKSPDTPGEVSIICVGTPCEAGADIELSQLENALMAILQGLKLHADSLATPHKIVLRSTIPPGTSRELVIKTIDRELGPGWSSMVSYVYLPEFLREGNALADAAKPATRIFASTEGSAQAWLKSLLGIQFQEVGFESAEMLKYYSNSFHALKVAFANEVATVAESYGVNSKELSELFLSDTTLNVSPAYLRPGYAYGGACLPKDLNCLRLLADKKNIDVPIISAIEKSNSAHIDRALEKLLVIKPKRLGVLGPTFKKESMSLKNSPVMALLHKLNRRAEGLEQIYGWSHHGKSIHWPSWIVPVGNLQDLSIKCDVLLLGQTPREPSLRELLKAFKGPVVDVNDLSGKWSFAEDSPNISVKGILA